MNKQELTKIYNQRFDSYDTTAEYMVYRIVTWYYIIGYHDKLVEFAKKCKQYKSESLFMKLLQYGISVDDIFFLEFVITHFKVKDYNHVDFFCDVIMCEEEKNYAARRFVYKNVIKLDADKRIDLLIKIYKNYWKDVVGYKLLCSTPIKLSSVEQLNSLINIALETDNAELIESIAKPSPFRYEFLNSLHHKIKDRDDVPQIKKYCNLNI